jgi:hypothetical protein
MTPERLAVCSIEAQNQSDLMWFRPNRSLLSACESDHH